ncbi:amidohydrolase family protein [Paenibacillus sp. LHD-117]|uniref:amidohydrolase family protein n=1 Tax=Paenibacillus sp. LHD-117 TaxID=3071412 RepID=UPI0027E0AC9B|nr:amidohydrolase family protein [Paenibacillus sp. LHD-117]MDQ6417964.1 amidohydrolase family protein [Paenibacillus sp. LHD-117]
MRIDAHQHYWTMSRTDYGWITEELPLLYRDYLPEHLEAQLKKHKMDGTILVQAAPTLGETEYILTLADRTSSILGVVGWLDLFDPNHREQFDRFRQHPKFAGFRIMIQDMPDASRILENSFVEALREYAKRDVPVDLLVKSDQLDVLCELLDAVPGLRGVIDHIGKPRIAEQAFEPWAAQIERASKHPKIYCKLSGMVTEADHQTWKPEQFKPYIEHVLRVFGSERVMFGTDWPVCLLAASYDEVVDVLEGALPEEWGEQERANLFGDNAKTFYKLK